MKSRMLLFVIFLISLVITSGLGQTISIFNDALGYSGGFTDSRSRLQYLNARYYDPGISRFIQRDSEVLINRYTYADGNPVMNTDPSGHFPSLTATSLDFLVPGLGEATTGKYEHAAIMFGAALGIGLVIAAAFSFQQTLGSFIFRESDFDLAGPFLARKDLPAASLFNFPVLYSESQGDIVIPRRIIPPSTGDVIEYLHYEAKANNFSITKNHLLRALDKIPPPRLTLLSDNPAEFRLSLNERNKLNLTRIKALITRDIKPENGLDLKSYRQSSQGNFKMAAWLYGRDETKYIHFEVSPDYFYRLTYFEENEAGRHFTNLFLE